MSIEKMTYPDLVRHLEKTAWSAGLSYIEFKNAQLDAGDDWLVATLKEAWDIRHNHSMHVMDHLLNYEGPVEIDTSPLDEANRVIQESKLYKRESH